MAGTLWSAHSGALRGIRIWRPSLVVGLGCEVFQIARMKEKYGLVDGDNFHSMTIQDSGGTRKTIETGVARIKEMLPLANKAPRETVPASELMVALQCGGSDGYSGITANPALGLAVDMLVGTAARACWPRRQRSMAPSTC